MPDNGWMCQNIPEYTRICVNMSKSAWMAFILHFPIVIRCQFARVITYFNVYTILEVIGCFLDETKFDFFWLEVFVFCFRLNIFTSNIEKCLDEKWALISGFSKSILGGMGRCTRNVGYGDVHRRSGFLNILKKFAGRQLFRSLFFNQVEVVRLYYFSKNSAKYLRSSIL